MEHVARVSKARLGLKILGKASIMHVVITSKDEERAEMTGLCCTEHQAFSIKTHLFLQTESPGQQSKA